MRGGYNTALSYDVIHDVFVLFTFAKVDVILFDAFVSDQSLALLHVFTARCYASAVLAMGLCLSVCLSVCVCHKSEFY